MIVLGIAFATYVLVSLWYIRQLHKQIRCHEADWNQIQKLTDSNKDGDVVIHVKHT